MVIASAPRRRVATAPVRVVFQAILGGLGVSPWYSRSSRGPSRLYAARELRSILFLSLLAIPHRRVPRCRLACGACRSPPIWCGDVYPGLLAAVWSGIVSLLDLGTSPARRSEDDHPLDRAAGPGGLAGDGQDMAAGSGSRPSSRCSSRRAARGSMRPARREVVRLLDRRVDRQADAAGGPGRPGRGPAKLGFVRSIRLPRISTISVNECRRKSLWIRSSKEGALAIGRALAHQAYRPAVAIIGSDPRALFDDSVDLQALNRAAQLATEIALRWAKKPKAGRNRPRSAD